MTVKISSSLDNRYMDNLERSSGGLPKLLNTAISRQITSVLIRKIRPMFIDTEPAALPQHPFVWSYNLGAQARARGWWFAALAGKIPGVIIPTDGSRYKRTGDLLRKFKLSFDKNTRTITGTNRSKGAPWTIGTRQVPSHVRTGWLGPAEYQEIADNATVVLMDDITDIWVTVTDKAGGVR